MEFRSTVDSFSLVLQESDSYPLPSGTAFHGLEKKIGHFFLYRHEKALNQTEEKWKVQKIRNGKQESSTLHICI